MKPRMDSPAISLPGALEALTSIKNMIAKCGIPDATLELVNLRASQINGCSVCVDMHARTLKKAGESDERIFTVSAWCEAPYFTDAERAVLALTEAATRLSDRPDPVPDEIWEEAGRHYKGKELSALVMAIGMINLWNRLNAVTRQVGGDWVAQYI